jgi:hypothetical protein
MTLVPPVTPPMNPPAAPPSAAGARGTSVEARRPAAPFLVWPISRKEFYRAIWISMMPALAGGLLVYGVRALAMLVAAVALTTFSHLLLKKWLRWPRGKDLLYAHCLTSVFVLVGLAHPLWPVWPMAAAALLLPLILATLGGPGKEPVHIAVVFVFAVQFALMPGLRHAGTYAGGAGGTGGEAVLARDRLLMGDLRNPRSAAIFHWPRSAAIEGADAFLMTPPAQTAVALLDDLSAVLSNPETEALAPLTRRDQLLFEHRLEHAFAYTLPNIELVLVGAVPERIGAVSLLGIALAGLYLSYRYVLRPWSVVLFAGMFILGTFATALSPGAIAHAGPLGLWHVLKTFPGELSVLLEMLILNSDAAFAAVFILALPGTEPLTPRGRRVFLIGTGVLAAFLHRVSPTLPAATLALCAAMPFTRTFDRLFGQRSWLNARP